jgi:hypothetical protein
MKQNLPGDNIFSGGVIHCKSYRDMQLKRSLGHHFRINDPISWSGFRSFSLS